MKHARNKKSSNKSKFKPDYCNDEMTFDDCELAILRQAVDETEMLQGQQKVNNAEIKKMLSIVEDFIIRKKLICYGGTAINNILPKYAQFYKRDIEIPDYDFFSNNALNDAKELADIYYNSGYTDVEAKSGIHYGTFKVFVNYIPIADITYLNKVIYKTISKEAIKIAGIKYAPPNYLRMSMYLELSRPNGDVSRWEKVMKRLNLLNKYYPLTSKLNCSTIDFNNNITDKNNDIENLNIVLRDALIDNGVIFFGGYSTQLYANYIPDSKNKNNKQQLRGIPDFDVLSEDPVKCAMIIKEALSRNDYKRIKTVKHPAIGDIIPEHVELIVGTNSMVYIYKPIGCHSYNMVEIGNKTVNIATIDTVLAFYLSFLYADMPYYDKDRLLCIAISLFNIEEQNRLEQRGILKRFSISCYGKQNTLEEIRSTKSTKFDELKSKRGSKEYEMWFLNYSPFKINNNNMKLKNKSVDVSNKTKKTPNQIHKPHNKTTKMSDGLKKLLKRIV
jgi:hypothetical protein